MKITGIQKNSFIDYPGKIAAVVFTPGCNMDCFYCHNRQIICTSQQSELIDEQVFWDFIKKRKSLLEGIVISGGEPTLQSDLPAYIKAIKDMGYSVKLDTNGTNPDMLQKLIEENLIDYVAMDIKAPFEKYQKICGCIIEMRAIQESIDLLIQSENDYEFRTTFVPQLTEEDGVSIAKKIKGAKKYVLQQYRKPITKGIDFQDERLDDAPYTTHVMYNIKSQVEHFVQTVELRGVS